MNFPDLGKHLWPMLFDDRTSGAFDFTRDAAAELHSKLHPLALQPIDERFARQDRCCRHRDVRFRLRPLFDPNFPAMAQKRIFADAYIGKFIRERAWAPRFS